MPQFAALPTRRRFSRWIVWLLVILMIAGGSWWFWGQHGDQPAEPSTTVSVALDDIEETVTAQGKLEPKEYVDVGAQVTGQLQKIYVKIGDNVEAGQLLAQIDPRIYAARVAAGEANIKNLQAQLRGQQAQAVFARQQYERNRELLKSQGVSVQDFQNSEFTFKNAEASVAALEAQIEQVQSTLNGDKTNLGFTKIYASMAGTMVDQKAREGQTLNANQTTPTILQLAKLDTMTVRAQVAEADVMRLQPDMPVYFTTLGSGERRWQARVRQILPTPEVINNVVLYNVLVDVDNRDRQLMSGMSTQMFFVLGRAEQVPLLPINALGARQPAADRDGGHAYQIKMVTDQGVQDRVVQIGLRNRRFAQVLTGLQAGERVQLAVAKDNKTKNRKKDQGYPGAGAPRL